MEQNGQSAAMSRPEAKGRVALVFMPFASLFQPSLALGQMQAQLKAAGLEAASHYFNFNFAPLLGITEYEIIVKVRGNDVQLGEWLFADEAWDEPVAITEREFLRVARSEVACLPGDPEETGRKLIEFRRTVVPRFLDDCVERLLADPDLGAVGISCVFQTVPAVALARRLKRRRPDLPIAFGGPSFHGEMGRELATKIDFIDAVAVGEADQIIVPLFDRLLAGRPLDGLPGVLWRDAERRLVDGGEVEPIDVPTLERLPDPDYTEYFTAMKESGVLRDRSFRERVFIPYETSRGCWWGQKSHCTFCGLNPLGMDYRMKSAERAFELVRATRRRWGVRKLFAVDNIVPQSYYKTLLPRLRQDPISDEIEIFTEIKTNVTREQIETLSGAGVRYVVPGIENLSSNILKSIAKGVTGLQNVFALKVMGQYGVLPLWNLLIRIPGEQPEDYTWLAQLIPQIEHLHPPFGGARKVEMHRFSPYHGQSANYAHRIWPQEWYRGIYPESRFDISRIAYYFDAEWKNVIDELFYAPVIAATWRWVDIWREQKVTPQLVMTPRFDGRLEVYDTRGGRNRNWLLGADEATVYVAMEDPISRGALEAACAKQGVDSLRAAAIIGELIGNGLAIEEDGKLLGLALRPGAPEPSLEWRRGVFQRIGQDVERVQGFEEFGAEDIVHA